jgi:DNA-binding transcriptional MocR family regulator
MSVYLEKLRAHFRKKYDLMKNLIEKSGVLRVRYVSDGGLFFWVELQSGDSMDSYNFYKYMKEKERVWFLPGNLFSQDGTHGRFLRLSYATPTNEQIRTGLHKIIDTLKQQEF